MTQAEKQKLVNKVNECVCRKPLARKNNIIAENLAVYSVQTKMEVNDYGVKYMVFNSFKQARLHDKDLVAKRIEVQSTTLDNYTRLNYIKPDFIKIDAELVELNVLQVGIDTTRSSKPKFMIKVSGFEPIDTRRSL